MQMYKEDYYHSVVEEEYMFKDEYSYNNGSTMHMMKPPAEHCPPKHSYTNNGAKMHHAGGGYGADQGHYGHHKEGMKLQGGYGVDRGHYGHHNGGGYGPHQGHYGHHQEGMGMNHGHGGAHQGHYGHHLQEGMGMNHGHGGGYGAHQGHYGNHNKEGMGMKLNHGGAYGAHQGQYCPPQHKVSVWEFKSIVD